jgi:hypothetical protein
MPATQSSTKRPAARAVPVMLLLLITTFAARAQQQQQLPGRIPPRRTSQIHDGFGINSDLPREPSLPWDRWWWTRMFDAGVSWIRIGQYENSSDQTSWDWVERKRGVFALPPQVDDYVDSLVDNGVRVQVQLLYGNPMYTSPAGRLPDEIVPEPGSFHNDDRSLYSVFWPPKTPQQIAAFIRYTRWMVNHFRGRIHYYALWNEQDIGYWNPWGNPEEYGRLLKEFVPAVHQTDPQARVIFGGLADPSRSFAKRALDVCQCASGIDVFAYHTYPGYGRNLNPETMDHGAYGQETPAKLRDMVRHYPGIRPNIIFWDDEFNSIPSWKGSDDSVQSKYIPRGMVYNWAQGVKTFVWLLTSATDGNEYDDFGLIHGLRYQPDDFSPRPVFSAYQNTNALFSDTRRDRGIRITPSGDAAAAGAAQPALLRYGFRSRTGKALVAYWLAARSQPGNVFPARTITLKIENSGIRRPALIDVVSGTITRLAWDAGSENTLTGLPLRDSVMAIADENYFDWPVLPATPSGLKAARAQDGVRLSWQGHGGNSYAVERRAADGAAWQRVATVPAPDHEYLDQAPRHGAGEISYRVRALNAHGESAFSNIVRVVLP